MCCTSGLFLCVPAGRRGRCSCHQNSQTRRAWPPMLCRTPAEPSSPRSMEGAVSGIPLQACHEDGAVAAHGDRGCIHAVIAQFRAGRAVELMFPGHARVGTEALENLIAQAGAHAEQAGIHGIEAEVLIVCFGECLYPLQNSSRRNPNEPSYSPYGKPERVQGYCHGLFLCRPTARSQSRKLQGARVALIFLFSLNFSILDDFY